jgi:HEAT repeat protein
MPHPLLDGSDEARLAAMVALVARPDAPTAAELTALRACLADPRKLIQRRAAEAFASLAQRGVAVEGPLHAALADSDLRLRWGVTYALSRVGAVPVAALPTLLEVIGLDDGDLRWAAAELIKQLAATEREPVVARLLAAAHEPGVRRKMALYCLRDLAVGEAFDAGVAALADQAIETRLAGLAVIAKLHPDADVAAGRITALLDDPDPRMQRAAAGTLGPLGVASDAVVRALHRASGSADPSLARAASRSLRQLGASS